MGVPVAVVVPAYNAEATLAETLASVASQTCAPREVIVVDDGSTDGTAALARRHGARVISIPNGGVACARNVAIRASTSPWIAFLDADDVWLPTRLARGWEASLAAPGTLVGTADYRYLAGSNAAVLATLPQYRTLARRHVAPGIALVRRNDVARALARGNFIAPSSLFVDRKLFDRCHTYFAERDGLPAGDDFYVAEDYEWVLRALVHSDVLVVEEPLFAYRRSPASLSGDGGRLKLGDVVLGELIAAQPERYAADAAAIFATVRAAQLAEAGLRFVRAGRVSSAHAAFVRARAAGDRRARLLVAATAPFVASPVGRRSFAGLYALWTRVVRPLARAIRMR